MQYLKIISDRASLLPIIATSLAQMGNREARYKAGALAARIVDENCDHGDIVLPSIKKLYLLGTAIQHPKLAMHSRCSTRRVLSFGERKKRLEGSLTSGLGKSSKAKPSSSIPY
ncbi:hypothetical protein ACHAQJ_000184 [Trichoderma viride]